MKRSENRMWSMIFLTKVVPLKDIYLNENHWLYTFQNIYSLKVSSSNYSHTLTDFFYKEMLTSLVSISSRKLKLLLKASVA